jgi:ribosomal-protein-alanine N-acetyltransferase
MSATFPVFRATMSDAAIMATIHASCFDRPWDAAAMTRFIASPGVLCLIGSASKMTAAPTGLLIARRADDEAEILTLAVSPVCRRTGLGRALLTRAMNDLRASGAQQLFLEVDEGNDAALALYRTLGATPVGRRPRYYDGEADAVIFSLALPDSRSDDGPASRESQ